MRSFQRMVKLFILLVAMSIGIDFCLHNEGVIVVNLGDYGLHLPRYVPVEVKGFIAFIVAFLAGAATLAVFMAADVFTRGLTIAQLRRRVRRLEADALDQARLKMDEPGLPVATRRWRFW